MSPKTNPANKSGPPTPLIRGDKVVGEEPGQNFPTQRYTEEATKFIRSSAKAGKPFFLYLPHTFPHVPLHASPRFRGTSSRGLRGDVVEDLDWSVGEALKTLREAGGSAGVLREGKASTWEGGMREPFLARWPGRIPAGVVTQAFGTLMDLFPTCVKISGAKMPADREYDGANLSPALFENSAGHPTVDPPEKYDVAAGNPAVVGDLAGLIGKHKATMKFGELRRWAVSVS
jgi:arylsulfatase A